MPTSTQRFRLVGEDDASRAFLQVAASAKLLKSNMDDVTQSSLALTKLIGGAGLIPVAAAATAAVAEFGTSLGLAGGALGVFGVSAGGFIKGMITSQKSIATTRQSLTALTKGTKSYHDAVVKLHLKQAAFNKDYGTAATGFQKMKLAYKDFEAATGQVTKGVMAKGFQLVADVLPKLVPVSNAAGKAVGGLIDDLSNWTKSAGFADLMYYLETSGPKDITAFGHIVGSVFSGIGGVLSNFVGPGDDAARSAERLANAFQKWGNSGKATNAVRGFLGYISDNGPQLSSVFKSLAEATPKLAIALGDIGSANLTLTGRFLSLVAGLPQKQFNLIADGLFAIAAGSKAIAVVNGLGGAAGAIGSLLKSKGIVGRAAGSAGSAGSMLGVQKVFVVNMAEGGLGGIGGGKGGLLKDGEKLGVGATLAAATTTGITLAGAAIAAGALAYIAIKVQGGAPKKNAEGGNYVQGRPGGMTPAQWRAYNAQTNPMGPGAASGLKSVGTALDSVKNKAEQASRAIELTGPRAKNAAGKVVNAIQTMNGRTNGLDSLKAKGAAASQTLDLIGPHAKASAGIAVTAISGVASVLAHIKDRKIKITADTSQAMANLSVMKYQLDQLHDKTIIVRAIGGHVPGEPTGSGGSGGGGASAGGSSGGGASSGKSAGFTSRSGFNAGTDYMTGLLKGIANKRMSVEAAVSKIADALAGAKSKLSSLRGVQAGFRGTFGQDSIFGQDFSTQGTATVNGEQVDQGTTPGTISDVLAFQTAQRDKARALNADIKRVTSLGLSKALVKQLRSQGAAGAATLHTLASASPAQIRQLNMLNRQTSSSLASAGMRAGDYTRGGSVAADIRSAKKTEHVLELLEHHLKDLAHSEKKGQTIVVEIDSEAIIRSVVRRNKRKGVKSAGM